MKTLPAHRGLRLDQILSIWLPEALGQPLSKAKCRKLLVAGAVYLNGKRVRIASKTIVAGARLEAFVDLAKLFSDEPSQDQPFQMDASRILYEDEYLIAIDKPPGLPTQPTLDEARQNLYAALKKFLSERDRVADAYVGLHHRLDRDTSGVILFTKSRDANAGVADLFAKHLAQKTYIALAHRPSAPVSEAWTVKNYLRKAPGGGKSSKFQSVRSGGDFAHTGFRILEDLGEFLCVEAMPKTGRTHQIRVHLSEAGMPILGDRTYGSSDRSVRLMLHAACLTFPHPITNLEVSVRSHLPGDFNQCLQSLRQAKEAAKA